MLKSFLKKTFVLLSLGFSSAYDRDSILTCFEDFTEQEKINLCVRWKHYETMWRDCAFNNYNN